MREPRTRLLAASCSALALACVALAHAAPVEVAPDWRDKIHPRVWQDFEGGAGEFVLFLGDQADVRGMNGEKSARARAVAERLREHALRTQAPLVSALDELGVEYRTFWIANMIWVRGDAPALARLARRGDVLRVDANPRVRIDPATAPAEQPSNKSISAVEWNLTQIGADVIWSLGYLGNGVVIGGQDTGYQWEHPALIGKYRGWNGVSENHAYNWHDSIHSGGGYCGANSPEPCDDDSHGSHTMGIMVGDDGGTNRIGVAPGARWIGCRNMDQGTGTPTTYAECFQWFIAPTDLAGLNPDPSRAPDVINNSWYCPITEGCSQGTLRTIVENTRAAGIVVVVSAGNSGPPCGSLADPPAHYDASFTVGSTSSLDVIAWNSARGPSSIDGSGRLKPDVSAPGVAVRSSVPFGIYKTFSGTSMAGPHVAGLVALLLDARPDLAGRVDDIEALITSSAHPLTTLEGCGGDTATSVPNNTYGWGRIDAPSLFTGDADSDGSSNLNDCQPLDPAQWSAPDPALGVTFAADRATLTWAAPADPGASAVSYDVLRSTAAAEFGTAECIASDVAVPSAADPETPTAAFFYLVRTENACGATLCESTQGPRSAPACD